MGREEDAHALVGKREEHIAQLVARDGIEPARRFVEDQQLSPVAEREGERVLDLHAGRKRLGRFALVEGKELQIALIGRLVPVVVKAARHGRDGGELFAWVIIRAAGDEGDAALDLLLMLREAKAEKAYLARGGVNDVEHALERRGLARAVAADEAHDPSAGERKADFLQSERRIFLAEAADLQHRLSHRLRRLPSDRVLFR